MRTYSIKTHWPRPGRNVTLCGYPLGYAEQQGLGMAASKDTVTCGSCCNSLDEPWHGTYGGYTNHNCPCVDCVAANAAYQQQWREDHRDTGPPEHGYNGYTNYGCRCGICREGRRLACRRRRASRDTERESA